MASITVTPNKHWLLYPLLIALLLVAIWLWRDTSNRDIAAIQAAAEAYKNQKTIDQQTFEADRIAQAALAMKNQSLQKQLAVAKTTAQQVQLINQNAGTHIEAPANNLPDAPIPVEPPDILQLAQNSTECAEAKNQVEADKVQIAGDQQQIDSRDQTIKDYNAAIKSLKGGSHFKRFLKAAKYWGIGLGTGTVVGIIAEKKSGL